MAWPIVWPKLRTARRPVSSRSSSATTPAFSSQQRATTRATAAGSSARTAAASRSRASKNAGVEDHPVLDDLGHPAAELAGRQGRQRPGVDPDADRLVEGADDVLGRRLVDPHLAADRAVDLRQQGRRRPSAGGRPGHTSPRRSPPGRRPPRRRPPRPPSAGRPSWRSAGRAARRPVRATCSPRPAARTRPRRRSRPPPSASANRPASTSTLASVTISADRQPRPARVASSASGEAAEAAGPAPDDPDLVGTFAQRHRNDPGAALLVAAHHRQLPPDRPNLASPTIDGQPCCRVPPDEPALRPYRSDGGCGSFSLTSRQPRPSRIAKLCDRTHLPFRQSPAVEAASPRVCESPDAPASRSAGPVWRSSTPRPNDGRNGPDRTHPRCDRFATFHSIERICVGSTVRCPGAPTADSPPPKRRSPPARKPGRTTEPTCQSGRRGREGSLGRPPSVTIRRRPGSEPVRCLYPLSSRPPVPDPSAKMAAYPGGPGRFRQARRLPSDNRQ